jgi:hypothetical protein
MYLLKMMGDATFTTTGYPVDLSSAPISLVAGWNWIGYLPQHSGDIGTALASLDDNAAFITSQASGSATYYPDYGQWDGSLVTLEPGFGYLILMNEPGELIYPEFDGLTRYAENKKEVMLTESISNWEFNFRDYEHNGNITVSIDNREDFEGDIVGVFVDDVCRGMAERMYFQLDDTYYYMIQVYSNVADGEELTFKYYDKANDEVIEYTETIEFTKNMVVGDGFNTFGLNRVIPTEFMLNHAYPNPFNPTTTLSFAIPVDSEVSLSIYNLQGREVSTLIDGNMEAGYHSAVWNASSHASGMYFVKMHAGNYISTQKLMLVK